MQRAGFVREPENVQGLQLHRRQTHTTLLCLWMRQGWFQQTQLDLALSKKAKEPFQAGGKDADRFAADYFPYRWQKQK